MGDFKVTFLGTGTSLGVPVIGCDCEICRSTDPRDKRLRTAIYIETPECRFVVDTPPDFRTQCLREKIHRLDAAIFTHEHVDHILGFDDLRRYCEMADRHMPVYASPRTMESLQRVFHYAFANENRIKTYVRVEPVEFRGSFTLGETLVEPVELPHGHFVTNGFVFSRHGKKLLAYYTDCSGVPGEAIRAASGASLLVLDALRHNEHSSHLTVGEAIHFSECVGAEQTLLIHMGHDLGHAATQAYLPPGVSLSYDGLQISLG
jgi:phosphoribosyl 1,2-cyclic phosphate phosphodiesterase